MLSVHGKAAWSQTPLGRFAGRHIENGPCAGAPLPTTAARSDLGRPSSNGSLPSTMSARSSLVSNQHVGIRCSRGFSVAGQGRAHHRRIGISDPCRGRSSQDTSIS